MYPLGTGRLVTMFSSGVLWRSNSPQEHVRELENQLRTAQDEALKEHVRLLKKAWGIRRAKRNKVA